MHAPSIEYRPLARSDLARLGEIDRSERIESLFRQHGELLEEQAVDHRVPQWFAEGEGEHSLTFERHVCERHLDAGAVGLLALEGDRLVGIGLVTPEVRPAVAQLAFLYVSNGRRGLGIGAALARELERIARDSGADTMVVSSIPSGATVRFYLAMGYAPTADPLPELYELEPDDVHMTKTLRA